MEETRIIYYVDDEETPYLIKFHSPPDQITLGDFKNALNRPNYKFFFKSLDDDFGVVKEEITDDDAKLPYVNGRVVSWLVVSEGSTQSDNHSSSGKDILVTDSDKSKDKGAVSDSSDPKSPSFRNYSKPATKHCNSSKKAEDNIKSQKQNHKFTGPEKITLDETDDAFDEIDSIYNEDKVPPLRKFSDFKHNVKLKKLRNSQNSSGNNNNIGNNNNNGTNNSTVKQQPIYESSSSMMSSDLESTSFFDSEDDSSRFSSATETTMSTKHGRQRRQLRRRRKIPHLSRASSFSSMTDSTVSLNIITVTLNMDTVPFLGISIVGQTNGNQENGDGGIYVGSIMKGGAVALDGRIEPGDMILEVNGISFENVSNEEAVRTLREQVQKLGPVTLVVAKSWDPNPPGYMLPQQDPVRPIDPRAWVLHTQAMGNMGSANQTPVSGDQFQQSAKYLPYVGAMSTVASTLTTTSSSLKSSSVVEVQNSQNKFVNRNDEPIPIPLTCNHDPAIIIRAMAQLDSGLPIRDRLWLKITIYNAFIGSDLVDWLCAHVQGFADRKDARKFATNLLKMNYIRHTVNKSNFSEQCYYVLNDMSADFSLLNLESEIDSVSVLAGQQQSKARLMHQEIGCKESPILSSGFQSASSNKWSSYNIPPNPSQEMYSQAPIYPITNNTYKPQNFYSENIQQQSHALVKPFGLSNNLQPTRGPGSVNSASVVTKNCVCLDSLRVLKAMKHMWEGPNKAVMSAMDQVGGSGGSSGGGGLPDKDPESNRNIEIKSTDSVISTTCRLCGGDQDEFDFYSNNDDDEMPHHLSMKPDAPANTSGSSASGSSSNVPRNMPLPTSHMQNQQSVAIALIPDSPPPSYQQSQISNTVQVGKNQSTLTGDTSSNQFSSDGVDKCD